MGALDVSSVDYRQLQPFESPFKPTSMHYMGIEVKKAYEGRCCICGATDIRLEEAVAAFADGARPGHAHGFLLRVRCGCEEMGAQNHVHNAHVHLSCVLSDDYYPVADDAIGYFVFRCTICGVRFDMEYVESHVVIGHTAVPFAKTLSVEPYTFCIAAPRSILSSHALAAVRFNRNTGISEYGVTTSNSNVAGSPVARAGMPHMPS